jgi:hypothetical protein
LSDTKSANENVPEKFREENCFLGMYRPYLYITHDRTQTTILSHFTYITWKMEKAKNVLKEENKYIEDDDKKIDTEILEDGWIWKSQEDIQKELMYVGEKSLRTLRRHLKELHEDKFLLKRQSDCYKKSNVREYRVCFSQIERKFSELGLTVEGSKKLPFTIIDGKFRWKNVE